MENDMVDKLMALGISGDNVAAARALLRTRHKEMGISYQPALYAMLLAYSDERKLGAVVETGSGAGLATWYINKAMAERGQGHLFSCDPIFLARGYALEKMRIAEISGIRPTTVGVLTDETRWTFLAGASPGALALAAEAAADMGFSKWTAFIHDSDPKILDREIAMVAPYLTKDSLFVVAGPASQRKDLLETFAKNGLLMDKPFVGENWSIWCVERVTRLGSGLRDALNAVSSGRPLTTEEKDVLDVDGPVLEEVPSEAPLPKGDEALLKAAAAAGIELKTFTKEELFPSNPNRREGEISPSDQRRVLTQKDGELQAVTLEEFVQNLDNAPPRTGDNIPEPEPDDKDTFDDGSDDDSDDEEDSFGEP